MSEYAQDELLNGTDLTDHAGGVSAGRVSLSPEQWARLWVVIAIAILWFLGGIAFKGRN